MHLAQRHIGAGYPAQNRLEMVAGRLLRAIERAAVVVHHADVAFRGLEVHARRREGDEPRAQLLGIGDGGPHAVAGELRFGTDEFEAREPTHRTASAIAADEPARRELLLTGLCDRARRVLGDGGDRDAAPDFHAQLGCLLGQQCLDGFEVGHHALHRRAGKPVRQGGDVDLGRIERHAG